MNKVKHEETKLCSLYDKVRYLSSIIHVEWKYHISENFESSLFKVVQIHIKTDMNLSKHAY